MKNKILPLINIIVSIILGIILLLADLSENTMYIMIMTLIIGWAIPYIVLLVTGISMVYNYKPKLSLTLNIINVILCIVLLLYITSIYDKKMIVFLITYIIIGIISIVNSIYYIIYIKNDQERINNKIRRKNEKEKIKKIKKENNGAIV
jgi:amino acid transporter